MLMAATLIFNVHLVQPSNLLDALLQVPHLQWLVRFVLSAHRTSDLVYTMALREAGRSTLLVAKCTLQTMQTSPTCPGRRTSPLETRVLRSSGECLPSTSVSVGISFDTPHLSTVHHRPRCHPACSQQSTNIVHPFQQPRPRRTLLCIELEVDLCCSFLWYMAHQFANPTLHLQCWILPGDTLDIQYLLQQCPHSAA
jgi:hypothetical protein